MASEHNPPPGPNLAPDTGPGTSDITTEAPWQYGKVIVIQPQGDLEAAASSNIDTAVGYLAETINNELEKGLVENVSQLVHTTYVPQVHTENDAFFVHKKGIKDESNTDFEDIKPTLTIVGEVRPRSPSYNTEPSKSSTSYPCSLCSRSFPTEDKCLSHMKHYHKADTIPNHDKEDPDHDPDLEMIKNVFKAHYDDSQSLFTYQPEDFANYQQRFQTNQEISSHACRICNKKFVTEESLAAHEKGHSLRKSSLKQYKEDSDSEDNVSMKSSVAESSEKEQSVSSEFSMDSQSEDDDDDSDAEYKPSYERRYKRAKTNHNRPGLHGTTAIKSEERGTVENSSLYSVKNQNHTRNNGLECHVCHKVFVSTQKLHLHMRCHNTNPLTLVREKPAPRKSQSSSPEVETMASRTEDGLWSCRTCSQTFERKSSLTIHQRSHNSIQLSTSLNNPEKHPCARCRVYFRTVQLLIAHMADCFKDRQYECMVCFRAFRRPIQLWEHEKMHERASEQTLHCFDCDKKFKNDTEFKEHVCGTKSKEQHVCKVCGSKFSQPELLTQHLKMHKKKMITKSIKRTKFSNKLDNAKKMSFQNVKQLHTCIVCQKKFVDADGLQTHMKVHDVKKHTCETCGKAFITLQSLDNHNLNVHS